MADLIERSEIVKVAEHAYHEWNLGMAAAEGNRQINKCYKMQELCKAVKAVAEAAPAVDAVPVIRCKDCDFYTTIEGERGVKYNICELHDTAMKENDFCSYGEPVNKPVESVDNHGN